jgi:hypothetical protein
MAVGGAGVGRAGVGRRFNLERGTDQGRAFLHARQAKALRSASGSRIEADAIIFDDEQHVVGSPLEDDVDVAGARVLGDVRQRLLRNAVERGFRIGRQPFVEQAGGVQVGGDADPLRPVLHVIGERRAQAKIVERRGPQLPDQMVDVAIELLSNALERIGMGAYICSFPACLFQHADSRAQCRQLFAELIVHFPRDPSPLVFLRKHQPGEELRVRALGLGLPACGEVEVRPDDPHHATVLAANRKTPGEHVDVMSFPVTEPEFPLVRRRATKDGIVHVPRPRHVVRMQDAFPGADVRFYLVLAVPEHPLPPW